MDEMLPALFGLICGAGIARAPTPWRFPLGLLATFAAGIAATLLSGEWASSWHYLLLDMAEAAAGFALSLILVRNGSIRPPRLAARPAICPVVLPRKSLFG